MKVIKEIIHPLSAWFEKKITDGKVDVYVEVLDCYDVSVLQKAMTDLKHSWTRTTMPQPAEIKQICYRYEEKEALEEKAREGRPMSFEEAAEAILPTPIGQQALRELWGQALVLHYIKTKQEDFTAEEINHFREARKAADEAARSINPEEPSDYVCLNLWWTMQVREEELLKKYLLKQF